MAAKMFVLTKQEFLEFFFLLLLLFDQTRLYLLFLLLLTSGQQIAQADDVLPACDALQVGQYSCSSLSIDPDTGGHIGCLPNKTAQVECTIFNGVECTGPTEYNITVPCRYTGQKSFSTALSLSVFLGIFGADRFYLGYPAYGFLKLMTLGLFFGGYYVDIILITTQVTQPADGTDYIIPVNGPQLSHMTINNSTYYVPLS